MKPRFASVLLAAAFLLLSVPAFAAPELFDIPDNGPADPQTHAACMIGELRIGAQSTVGLIEPGTKFYQLLDPATCTACSSVYGRAIRGAVIRLRYLNACDIVFRVSVVNATAGPCPAPDTTQMLCAPFLYTVSETTPQLATKSYTLPFSNGCCIEQNAFLMIEVVSMSCPMPDIAIAYATGSCQPCKQYIHSPTHRGPGTFDQCAGGFSRNYRIWADVDCCGAVGESSRTWGRIKTLYR